MASCASLISGRDDTFSAVSFSWIRITVPIFPTPLRLQRPAACGTSRFCKNKHHSRQSIRYNGSLSNKSTSCPKWQEVLFCIDPSGCAGIPAASQANNYLLAGAGEKTPHKQTMLFLSACPACWRSVYTQHSGIFILILCLSCPAARQACPGAPVHYRL